MMNIAEKEPATVKSRAIDKLRRDMGEVIERALIDPKTIEIMLNDDGTLWQERLGEKMRPIGVMSENRAESIIKTVAGFHNKEVTRFNPLIEGELPIDGSRFSGQLPPVVSRPVFTIRKKAISVFTLDEYVASGVMSERQCQVIKMAVKEHRNILVIGGTGTGKTTLVNAIIGEMVEQVPEERMIIIEDTAEIQCKAKNKIQYHTTSGVDMTTLLRTTLRMRPDRILVGEVRGAEALDLVDAWNTGHEGGAATLHANNCLAGLRRLKSLITRNPFAPSEIEALIAEVVHVVVQVKRESNVRKIDEILSIKGFENGQYQIERLTN